MVEESVGANGITGDGPSSNPSEAVHSVFFKGLIPHAVDAAKDGQKILVVYVSGSDEVSTWMEQTWIDSAVVKCVREDCIALRLEERSRDANSFSSLYPIRGVPSITLVGHDGSCIGQKEGHVTAEEFLKLVQDAKSTLQFRSAAAASAMMAMLSSVNLTRRTTLLSPSPDVEIEDRLPSSSVHGAVSAAVLKPSSLGDGSPSETLEMTRAAEAATVAVPYLPEGNYEARVPALGSDQTTLLSSLTVHPGEDCGEILVRASSHEEAASTSGLGVVDSRTMAGVKASNKIWLAIRLPDGKTMQEEFENTDLLLKVKERVDGEWTETPYDLAIRFPVKVFTDHDLYKTLVELKLGSRDGLMVIPRFRKTSPSTPAATERSQAPDTNQPSILWRLLSYVNPLAYLRALNREGSGHTSVEESTSPPQGANRVAGVGRGPGSNIHTLQNDGVEGPRRGGNAYWNGNSTQFGANDD